LVQQLHRELANCREDLESGSAQEAIRVTRKLANYMPDSVEVQLLMARALLGIGQEGRAASIAKYVGVGVLSFCLLHLPCSPSLALVRSLGCRCFMCVPPPPRRVMVLSCSAILRDDQQSVVAIFVRGMSFYKQGELERAIAHFARGLKYDPDNKLCRDAYRVR
jgi:tetratricopeptide (TPR) repeat protein